MESVAIDVLYRLLCWCPSSRMAAIEAQSHSYFAAEVSPKLSQASISSGASAKSPRSAALSESPSSTALSESRPRVSAEMPAEEKSGVSTDLSESMGEEVVVFPGPGSGVELSKTSASTRCRCSMNCGNTLCERAKKKKRDERAKKAKSPVEEQGVSNRRACCPNVALHGFTHCVPCKCEKHDCDNRKWPRDIFCSQHMQEQSNLKKDQYMNKWSVWSLAPAWPWELQMVAIHGWMLARMCPCDMEALLVSAPDIVGQACRLTGAMLLHLWAIAFLKWPKCVSQWASICSGGVGQPGVSAGNLDVQAEHYAAKAIEFVSHCEMDDMQWMHQQISVRLQHVLFGPVMWLSKLGMNPGAECKRRKIGTGAQPESHSVSVAVGKNIIR